MNSQSVYCFPDTNALLHFEDIRQVDWLDTLQAGQVQIVLAPQVITELNKFKDDHTNEGRRNRARSVLSMLNTLLGAARPGSPVELRSQVELLDLAKEPSLDWPALGLDPIVADDRLIASILEFRQTHAADQVLLWTHDFPAQRKAMLHRIETRDPEGLVTRIELQTPQAKQLRQLQQKVQEFESRAPKLTFGFWENNVISDHVERTVSHPPDRWISDSKIEEVLKEKQHAFEQKAIAAQGKFDEDDIRDSREEYRYWLEDLREFTVKTRACDYGRRCELCFLLRNVGNIAAQDVDVRLEFPPESFVVAVDDVDSYAGFGRMELEKEPTPKWLRRRSPLDRALNFNYRTLKTISPPREPEPEGPIYDSRGDRDAVTYRNPKLRPMYQFQMRCVFVYLPPLVDKGFSISCHIHADGLPTPITKTLHVRLLSP